MSTSPFRLALEEVLRARGTRDERGSRRYLFVPYDQLGTAHGPLARANPRETGIVLVESPEKAAARPYHKQKLALVLANLRHFAIEQADQGFDVRHLVARGGYGDAIVDAAATLGPMTVMRPAERELRMDLEPAVKAGVLSYVPHEGWLTSREDFLSSQRHGPPYRMDAFYRVARQRTGLLVDRGKPHGGKWSFDSENRKRWNGRPTAPQHPTFSPDPITLEVGELIESRFAHHPGRLRLDALPATHADAEKAWSFAKLQCLPMFGPFEDAMSTVSRRLFHSCVSPLLNLSRLSAHRLVHETEALDAPLASREGFIRQILGWREFVRHVHEETDGFRTLAREDEGPGDGGYARWAGEPWLGSASPRRGGAHPDRLGTEMPLPAAYWGTASGLACLDRVVESVWDEAYSHHITRLMILSNIATLLDISPRELTDWFWVAYADAYDWVVEPNVLAMGTFSVGDLMTTKPYVAGSAYVDKMSDFCGGCAFDPRSTCPLRRLYWAYLERHRPSLDDNPRLKLPLASSAKRSPAEKAHDLQTFEEARRALLAGEILRPSTTPSR